MYNFFYYNYYSLARFFKANVPGSFFYNTALDGVIVLSLMEFLNIVALGIWLQIPCITTNYNLDMALLGIALLGLNSLYFLRNKRYAEIVGDCEKAETTKKRLLRILTIVYSALSFCVFFLVHSST